MDYSLELNMGNSKRVDLEQGINIYISLSLLPFPLICFSLLLSFHLSCLPLPLSVCLTGLLCGLGIGPYVCSITKLISGPSHAFMLSHNPPLYPGQAHSALTTLSIVFTFSTSCIEVGLPKEGWGHQFVLSISCAGIKMQ